MNTQFNRKHLVPLALGAAFLAPFASECQADEENSEIPTVCLQIGKSSSAVADRSIYSADDFVAKSAAIRAAWARVHYFDEPEPFVPAFVASAGELEYVTQSATVQVASIGAPEQIMRVMPGGVVALPPAAAPRLVTTSDEAARYVGERLIYAQRVAMVATLRHCSDQRD